MTDPKSLAAASIAHAARAHVSPAAVPASRKRIALGVAILADCLQAGMFPYFSEGVLSPFQDALDVGVAIVLTLTLGFRWRLLLAFVTELIPAITLFPSWSAVVLSLPTLPAAPTDSGTITIDPVHNELPSKDRI